jgi:hypothetical protein
MQRQLAAQFRKKISKIELTRQQIENLFDENRMREREILILYEGMFLKLVTTFEAFLEELFIKIMLDKTSYSIRRVTPRIVFRSGRILREVLLQGQDYLEWLPYPKTVARANAFLRGGRPFTELSNGEISKIKQAMRVRNCVAHASDHAKRIFEEKVIGNLPITPRERSPSGFLRSLTRINPPLCRFQVYLNDFSRISYTLTR